MLHACYLLVLSVAYKSSDCYQTAAEIISLLGFVKSWEFSTKSGQSSRGHLVFWTAGVFVASLQPALPCTTVSNTILPQTCDQVTS